MTPASSSRDYLGPQGYNRACRFILQVTLAKSPGKSTRIPARWRKVAEERCSQQGARLTPARLAAYAELLASDRPLSAYELIARLERREDRKIAPLTVYRHLDFLMGVGLVHRLESTQSYLPCDHPEQTHESQYLLCNACGHVDELESKPLGNLLDKMADQRGFQPESAIVEVKGLCGNCAAAGSH